MPFFLIALGTFMWSLDTLIRYPLLSTIDFSTMVFIEHLFLVLYFVPFLMIHKFNLRRLAKNDFISFAIIGAFGSAVGTLAFTKAFSVINPSIVILLQKLQPIVAISLSVAILKEKLSSRFFLLSIIGLAGAALISFPDIAPMFQGGAGTNADELLGYSLTLLAVVSWGASTVFGKRLSNRGFTESEIMAGRFIFGFIFLLPFCKYNSSLPNSELNLEIYLKILGMVFISGLLGMYFYYKGLRQFPAHLAAVAELFFPVSALLINWIFLNKNLQAIQIGGAILLMASAVLLQFSRSKNASAV